MPGKPLLGVGGAMDLACGAGKLIVTMQHCDRSGQSKVVQKCDLPVTAKGVVDVLITDRAVFRFTGQGMSLVKLMPGYTLEQIEASTDAPFVVDLG
nr:CoA-transferase [Kineobactrum salinum]